MRRGLSDVSESIAVVDVEQAKPKVLRLCLCPCPCLCLCLCLCCLVCVFVQCSIQRRASLCCSDVLLRVPEATREGVHVYMCVYLGPWTTLHKHCCADLHRCLFCASCLYALVHVQLRISIGPAQPECQRCRPCSHTTLARPTKPRKRTQRHPWHDARRKTGRESITQPTQDSSGVRIAERIKLCGTAQLKKTTMLQARSTDDGVSSMSCFVVFRQTRFHPPFFPPFRVQNQSSLWRRHAMKGVRMLDVTPSSAARLFRPAGDASAARKGRSTGRSPSTVDRGPWWTELLHLGVGAGSDVPGQATPADSPGSSPLNK